MRHLSNSGRASRFCAALMLSGAVAATAVAPVSAAPGNSEGSDTTSLSSAVGSSEIQDWYNQSPDTGKTILTILGVIVALEGLGFIFGPLRSVIFNLTHPR